ncbi:MAG: type II toxin-antitoxin system CcdA family antitoxin [Desulfobacteraceae bacterium]
MQFVYDKTARKKPANLSINSDLLRKAREYGINLSAELEKVLADIVREEQRKKWIEDNREAINTYNKHVEIHGVYSRGLRKF